MFDWGSFVTGLVGALVGGAATLSVQAISARRDRRTRRREVAIQVGEAFRAATEPLLLREESSPHNVETFRALQEIARASVGLRLELTKRELPVAEWVSDARKQLARIGSRWGENSHGAKNVKALTGVVNSVNKHLAEWATGRERAKWFAEHPFPEQIALKADLPSSPSGEEESSGT